MTVNAISMSVAQSPILETKVPILLLHWFPGVAERVSDRTGSSSVTMKICNTRVCENKEVVSVASGDCSYFLLTGIYYEFGFVGSF